MKKTKKDFQTISFKISEVDYKDLKQKAEKMDLTLSEYIRKKVLGRLELKNGGVRYSKGITYSNMNIHFSKNNSPNALKIGNKGTLNNTERK